MGKRQVLIIGVALGVIVIGLALYLTAGLWLPWARGEDSMAIFVNGQGISRQTFDRAYQSLLAYDRSTLSGSERADFERQLLGAPGAHYQLSLQSDVAESLIRRTLLEQEARKLGVDISESDVKQETQRELRDFLKANGAPPQQIEQILNDPKSYQSSFTRGLMERVREQMREDGLRQRVVQLPPPTRADLESYYKEYRDRYYRPALVRVRRILLKLPQDATAKELASAREKLEALKQQLQTGAPFDALAQKYSQDDLTAPQGGEMGWIQEGDPEGKDFVDLAFSLKPGEVGGPVRTPLGLELLQTEQIQPAQGDTLDAVLDQVRSDYIGERTNEAFAGWFNEIYQEAQVTIKLPLIAAFRLEQQDPQAALRAYEAIRDKKLSDDPYLGYYIASLARMELDQVEAELNALPKGASAQERTALEKQADGLKAKVLTNLKDVLAQGRGEDDLYQAILELDPQDQGIRMQYAQYLLAHYQREEALTQLKALLAQEPKDPQALALYGQALFKSERYADAVQALKQALAVWPPNPADRADVLNLRLTLAQAERNAGQLDAARADFQALLKDDPQNFEANRALGEIAIDGGDAPGAILYLRVALHAAPADQAGELRAQLGQAYLTAGQIDQAQESFQAALASKPPAAQAYLGLGQIDERKGLAQQALDAYRQGLKQAVGWPLQEELAKHILALDSNDVSAHLALAKIYSASHQEAEAIAEYRTVARLQPSVSSYLALGDLYLQVGQLDQASTTFRQALALQPPPLPLDASGLWARILSVEEEQTGSQKALNPEGLEALYQLAQINLQALHHPQEAAGYLAQLRAANPDYRPAEVGLLIAQLQGQGIQLPPPQTPPGKAG